MASKDFLSRCESAEHLKALGFPTTKKTLDKLATVGGGPRFHKFGSRVLYRPEDLIEWAQSRLSASKSSTSDMGAAV